MRQLVGSQLHLAITAFKPACHIPEASIHIERPRNVEQTQRVPRSLGEASTPGQCRRIAGAMQHSDDHDRVHERPIVNGVRSVERDTQPRGKRVSRWCGEGKVSNRLKRGFNRRDKAGRDFLGRLSCQISPDFGEVVLGGLGETKR